MTAPIARHDKDPAKCTWHVFHYNNKPTGRCIHCGTYSPSYIKKVTNRHVFTTKDDVGSIK